MSFQIKSSKKETENKTVRFPVSLINKIEEAIINKDTTFSSFVIQACEYVLEDLEKNKKASDLVKSYFFYLVINFFKIFFN